MSEKKNNQVNEEKVITVEKADAPVVDDPTPAKKCLLTRWGEAIDARGVKKAEKKAAKEAADTSDKKPMSKTKKILIGSAIGVAGAAAIAGGIYFFTREHGAPAVEAADIVNAVENITDSGVVENLVQMADDYVPSLEDLSQAVAG